MQYIPDLTERYPEGLDGVDLTENYFPEERTGNDFMDEISEVFNKEPEQTVEGQQRRTYHNGYGMENPNREQVREPYTEAELIERYDRAIKVEENRFKGNDYWTERARQIKEKNLRDWKESKVVNVYSESYCADGMDWADTYYSDGTKITSCYGYYD